MRDVTIAAIRRACISISAISRCFLDFDFTEGVKIHFKTFKTFPLECGIFTARGARSFSVHSDK